MVDDSLKRFYHGLGLNIVRFSEKKIPLDENGKPKTGAVLEELHPIRPDVMAAKNWGVKHSLDKRCENILFLDWDRGTIRAEVRRLMITYRNKDDQESCHGIIRVADADKRLCKKIARNHGMAGLEIFAGKKNLALFGNYEIKDTDRRSQWYWIDSIVENGKVIDVTKEKLGRVFQRKARVTGSAAVPAGRGKRHNAILKDCFRLARQAKKNELDYGYLYGKITGSPTIEGMEEYKKDSAKHPELADMINFVLENQTDAKFGTALVRDLYPYAHIEDGPKTDQLNCWFYASGMWHDNTIHMVLTELLKFESEEFHPTSSMAKTIAENLSTAPRTLKVVIDVDYREMRKMMAIDKYGSYFDLRTGKVLPIDPTIHFFEESDVAFRIDADAPEPEDYAKFRQKRFPDSWEIVRDHFAGMHLHPSILGSKPKKLNIVGDHDTYKSLVLELEAGTIHDGSISNVTAARMSADNFGMALVADKILNYSEEEETRMPENPGKLKDVITKKSGYVRVMYSTKLKYAWRFPRWATACNRLAPQPENDEDDSMFIREMYVEAAPVAEDEREWRKVLDGGAALLQQIGMSDLRRAHEIYVRPGCMVTQSLEESRAEFRRLSVGKLDDFIKRRCDVAGRDTVGVTWTVFCNELRKHTGSNVNKGKLKKQLEDEGYDVRVAHCTETGEARLHTYEVAGRDAETQRTLVLGLKFKERSKNNGKNTRIDQQ